MHVSELATGKNLDCINSCTRITISPQKVSFIFYIQTVIVTLQRLFECGFIFYLFFIFFCGPSKAKKIWGKKNSPAIFPPILPLFRPASKRAKSSLVDAAIDSNQT